MSSEPKNKPKICILKLNHHHPKWKSSGSSKNRRFRSSLKWEILRLFLVRWRKDGMSSREINLKREWSRRLLKWRRRDRFLIILIMESSIWIIFLLNGNRFSMLSGLRKSIWKIRKFWSAFLKKLWFIKRKRLLKKVLKKLVKGKWHSSNKIICSRLDSQMLPLSNHLSWHVISKIQMFFNLLNLISTVFLLLLIFPPFHNLHP